MLTTSIIFKSAFSLLLYHLVIQDTYANQNLKSNAILNQPEENKILTLKYPYNLTNYESAETTLLRKEFSGHPECHFIFNIRLPTTKKSQTVCVYWRVGALGVFDLRALIHIYENGFNNTSSVTFQLRKLGVLVLNGNLLKNPDSYIVGYILGRDFYGMLHLPESNFFIEPSRKFQKPVFPINYSESVKTRTQQAIVYREDSITRSSIGDSLRKKRQVKKSTDEEKDETEKGINSHSLFHSSIIKFLEDESQEHDANKIPSEGLGLASPRRLSAFGLKKSSLSCKITLMADQYFFEISGRGNEASTVGRMLYYLDFVDSFLRDGNWIIDGIKTNIGLHLEQVHLETMTLDFKPDRRATLDSVLNKVSHFLKGKTNCFTVVFTANPGNANTYKEKIGKICASVVMVPTVSILGYELPDSEIIKNLLESVLKVFGADHLESNCDNGAQLRSKYFRGSVTNLSLQECIHQQLLLTLAEKEHSGCLKPRDIEFCGDSENFTKKGNCDCGYKGLCLSETQKCCSPIFHRKPFRECGPANIRNIQSRCHEPKGICGGDSVCVSVSNYINGTLSENYAVPHKAILTEDEDGNLTSSEKTLLTLHRGVIFLMTIFCHLYFIRYFSNEN